MRLMFLTLLIFLPASLFLSGTSFAQDGLSKGKRGAFEATSDSLQAKHGSTKTIRTLKKEDSIYDIDIKEAPSTNSLFTRKILSKFTHKNLRSILIGWNTYIPKPFERFYITLIEDAFHFPIVFYFLAIILLLFGNLLTVIGVLFVTNWIMNYREKRRKKIRVIFENIITDLMLQVTDTKTAIGNLAIRQLKNHYDLLIDVLMDFQKSFRGGSDLQIIELYREMDLGRISYNKTFAISFYRQVKGIRELANLHPYHATEMIISRLNDPNEIVRAEARICYPQINTESPFDFLSLLETPFSQWAQLNIYYFIKIHELPVPSFDKWLHSKHPNVVNFCIQMILLFQQHENSSHVILLLQSPNEVTRNMIIRTCGELHLIESKNELKEIYLTDTLKNKLEITKVFLSIGDDKDIPFLEDIVRNEIISLRLEACRTLYNLSETGRDHLESVNQSMNFVLSPYIAHIKDFRN